MQWVQAGKTREYAFTYDALSRLTGAAYTGESPSNFAALYTYDKHGSMKTMKRYGLTTATTYGLIDDLTMTYTGNQLLKAEDAVATISLNASMDFKNYSNVATEYTYNKNGAMNKDLNKGVSAISYNSLNLPRIVDIKNMSTEGRNEYTYSASGVKLKAVQKWNSSYSTAPVIGSAINTAALNMTQTTDYVGNKIYEDGVLKRILVNGGYYEGGNYYFYIQDHLGNNRIVANAAAAVVQRTQYYPFGTPFADATGQSAQPYKYNGKELDMRNGLNMHDYSARWKADWYFPTVDPLAEKYYAISPYAYCLNNPLRWIDKDGRDPGDPFKTPAEAALDFAKYYNGTSIVRNREFVSMVYKTEVDGKTTYSYTNANIGSASRAIIPDEEIPTGATSIAIAHTHSKYDPLSPNPHETNNNFSDTDKKAADQRKVDNYVATPDGSVKKYDTKTQKTNDLGSKDIPSDPNDPKRRNKTDPKDTNPTYNDPSGIDKIDKLKELLDK